MKSGIQIITKNDQKTIRRYGSSCWQSILISCVVVDLVTADIFGGSSIIEELDPIFSRCVNFVDLKIFIAGNHRVDWVFVVLGTGR